MKLLESYEEYRAVRKNVRGEKMYNSITFMPKELQRYIEMGRVRYEQIDGALFLFFDEDAYVRLCMYLDTERGYEIPYAGKMMYTRLFFRENEDPGIKDNLTAILTSNGYLYKDAVWETRANVEEVLASRKKLLEEHIARIKASGLRIVKAGSELFPAIDALMKEASFLETYHFPYRTEEERAAVAQYGGYICILNGEGELCGSAITEIHDGVGDGTAIAVAPKYRLSGLASVLCYLRLEMLHEQGIRFATGSVSDRNTASKKFFLSMGYEILDRKIDEWVMEHEKD